VNRDVHQTSLRAMQVARGKSCSRGVQKDTRRFGSMKIRAGEFGSPVTKGCFNSQRMVWSLSRLVCRCVVCSAIATAIYGLARTEMGFIDSEMPWREDTRSRMDCQAMSQCLCIYNEKDGLLNSCVWSLAEDAKHDLWVGTWGGGLFQFHEGRFIQYSKPQGLQSDVVLDVLAAHDGSLWLSCGDGLSQMRDGLFRNYTMADGLPDGPYSAVCEDQARGIWADSYPGTEHLLGGRFEPFSASEEIPQM